MAAFEAKADVGSSWDPLTVNMASSVLEAWLLPPVTTLLPKLTIIYCRSPLLLNQQTIMHTLWVSQAF